MSSAALSAAGRFPVRRKRPNRQAVDNAPRLLASTGRVPVQQVDHLIQPRAEKVIGSHLQFARFLSGFTATHSKFSGIPGREFRVKT